MTAEKQKALYNASEIIRKMLWTKKPFMDFNYIYGTGVLFRGVTKEEAEDLYNQMKK